MFSRFEDDCGCEQRMESGQYAVVTLLFAVPQVAVKFCNFRKQLKTPRLREIIRRSQLPIRKLTLLVTLFCGRASARVYFGNESPNIGFPLLDCCLVASF